MKALIVVDTQNDFFEGGALEVSNSNAIIPTINNLIEHFDEVIFTQDWHPENHKSFATMHEGKKPFDLIDLNGLQQVLWPVHCVQGSEGAEFKKEIVFDKDKHTVVTKGSDPEVDSYSGFFDNGKKHQTSLNQILKDKGIKEVYVCGLAADFCVKFTAIDAAKLKYRTYLITNATRPVDSSPRGFGQAISEMKGHGIYTIKAEEIINF